MRALLIRQCRQTIDALRGHLTEFGEVVPKGAWNARRLAERVEAEDDTLPEMARATLQVLVDGLRHLDEWIAALNAEIARRARQDELARRLMTIPGVGPLIAAALATLVPPPEYFRRARDFAAWLGLTPRQHLQHLPPPQLAPKHRPSQCVHPVQLEYILRQIEPDRGNLPHDRPPRGSSMTHLGTPDAVGRRSHHQSLSETSSSGLSVSIVEAVARGHGGTLTLVPQQPGLPVVLELPIGAAQGGAAKVA